MSWYLGDWVIVVISRAQADDEGGGDDVLEIERIRPESAPRPATRSRP